jgi:hypothetical protein
MFLLSQWADVYLAVAGLFVGAQEKGKFIRSYPCHFPPIVIFFHYQMNDFRNLSHKNSLRKKNVIIKENRGNPL